MIGSLGFLFGCQQDVVVPGTGNGSLGLAFVLGTGGSSQVNARTLNNSLEISEGFIQIKDLELEMEGRDDNGEFEEELEIDFDEIRKVTFNQFDKSRDFLINIPEGEYEEIEMELDLIDHRNEPSIYLEGRYPGEDSEDRQVIFEYFGDDIDFEVEIEAEDDDAYFVIDGVNNPLALLEINAYLWCYTFHLNKYHGKVIVGLVCTLCQNLCLDPVRISFLDQPFLQQLIGDHFQQPITAK